MRGRIFLLASLALNAALAAAWLLSFSSGTPAVRRVTRVVNQPPTLTNITFLRNNVVVTTNGPAALNWAALESSDYPTYIANLRTIGCPRETIRDLIVADVNLAFNRRRAALHAQHKLKWWRADMGAAVEAAEAAQAAALDAERNALLTTLLGPDWDAGEMALDRALTATILDGPVLGELSTETKSALRDIEARGGKRIEEFMAAQEKAGKPVEDADLWKLRQQTREALAKVLTPTQLEEYLLRHSEVANEVRNELGSLDATADEFRAIFRARDAFDQRQHAEATGDDPASERLRAQLEQQRDNAIKLALGPQRFEEYQLNQDASYRDTFAALGELGASPDKARNVYQINQATQTELLRIANMANLTEDQQSELTARVSKERDAALQALLGQDVFTRYQAQQSVGAQINNSPAPASAARRLESSLGRKTISQVFDADKNPPPPPLPK